MAMKVYVAARYGRRVEMQAVHSALRAAGFEPTSKWVDGNEEGMTAAQAAKMDVEDVRRAEALLFMAEPVGFMYSGGGRNFELGLAYERGMPCVVVGEREHVFLNLPDVSVHATVELAVAYLTRVREGFERVMRAIGGSATES